MRGADSCFSVIRRALVVEDAISESERLKSLVERRDVQVTCVDASVKAQSLLATEQFDLVLCDWQLPGENGLAICRAVSALEDGDRPYFIMVTGRSQRVDMVAAMDAGADDFLEKPLWHETLRVRLKLADQILGWRRAAALAATPGSVI
ncbi:PleD family two-component system response regulator [Litorivivens sp.]|uniref:response regulator n=1 Tax=Litorivivens sp. TaxID=2020868 RepID=UPI003564AF0C